MMCKQDWTTGAESSAKAMGTGATIVVIGAGFGGLASAIRLAAAGARVEIYEAQGCVGGKARDVPSAVGPIAAGPTVLTLRDVFDDLFALSGGRLDDHVTLTPLPILARHVWPDGSTLDLGPSADANAAAIRNLAGARAEGEFRAFGRHTAALRAAFEGAVMRAPRPRLGGIIGAAVTNPGLWPALIPGATLAGDLARRFTDPRLRQLFGRYATYVGGLPHLAPAVLALIWQAEGAGVWAVTGGMSALARALADRARALGVAIHLGAPVAEVVVQGGKALGIRLAGGPQVPADAVVFNGDPRALRLGLLGPGAAPAVPPRATDPRSLSARVWAFAGRPSGVDLAYHTVFFADTEASEFGPLARGQTPQDPTIYVCAQDRAGPSRPNPERFEMILNAPPLPHPPEDPETCRQMTFARLARMGLTFDSLPDLTALTLPQGFDRLFPGSNGALYGLSPHGAWATFRRPSAQTRIPGLVLAGGGAHPGAGVPMAALSGLHAAQAVLRMAPFSTHPPLTVPSARADTPGGISTGSATTERAPSR